MANAIDYLRVLAKPYSLDLKRVVIVGHSSGGHLGTWAAARRRLPKQSPLFFKNPLHIAGIVNLAGVSDLERFLAMESQVCGDPVVTRLLGGSLSEVPDRYRQASPSTLLPIRVKQVLITGAQDKFVPPWLGQKYEEEAKKTGDDVTFVAVKNASHFEVIAPGSVAWPKVEEAVLSMLRLKKETSK